MEEPKVTKREFKLTDSIEKLKGVLEYLGIPYRLRVHETTCEDLGDRLLRTIILEWDCYHPEEYGYEIYDNEYLADDGTVMDLSDGEHVMFFEHRVPSALEFRGMITEDEAVARILDYDYNLRISKWNTMLARHVGIGDEFMWFSDSVLKQMGRVRQYGGKVENVLRH